MTILQRYATVLSALLSRKNFVANVKRPRAAVINNYSWPVPLVAVAPVLAQCTNRCTRRKGAVNAQPTNTEKPKMKKTRHHEKVVKCQNESTRVARLQLEPHGRERRRVGQNWLRMKTKAILTCESSKNLNLFFTIWFHWDYDYLCPRTLNRKIVCM